jgi:hypothetical protein
VAFEIGIERRDQLGGSDRAFLENQLLDGRQRVGGVGGSRAVDAEVVVPETGRQIATALEAAVHDD